MILPDKPESFKNYKLPTIENKNDCFLRLKEIINTENPNGEWYNYEKLKKEYLKCIYALKEEKIIEIGRYSDFKFTDLGYEVYNADSYIDYTIKKNILYFIVDAMKDGDSLNFDNLINKVKPSKQKSKLLELLKESTTREAVSLLLKEILSSYNT